MEISKNIRKELNSLSKEIFGTSSRWQKLVDKGYEELLTEDHEEVVPPAKEGDAPTTNLIKKPVLNSFGAKRIVRKYHTVDSVKEYMLEQKKRIDEVKAKIAKAREEMRTKLEAEKQAKKVNEEFAGSVAKM